MHRTNALQVNKSLEGSIMKKRQIWVSEQVFLVFYWNWWMSMNMSIMIHSSQGQRYCKQGQTKCRISSSKTNIICCSKNHNATIDAFESRHWDSVLGELFHLLRWEYRMVQNLFLLSSSPQFIWYTRLLLQYNVGFYDWWLHHTDADLFAIHSALNTYVE